MRHIFSIMVLLCFFSQSLLAYQAGFRSITFTDPARSNRSIPCDVYYPANQAGNEVPLAQGEFPHLVFGHGFLMATSAYEPIASALAEQGFVVFLPRTETGLFPNHTNFARDLAFVAEDALLKATNDPAFFFYESLNGRFAIGGHSMGGGCTYLSYQYLTSPANALFTFAAAETNPSAVNQMGAILAPNLLLAGSLDCVTPPADHQIPMYQAQHPDACKNYVEITGGYHCQFNASNFNCNLGEGSCQPSGGISREAQIQLTLDLLIPWLQAWLYPDCDAWQAFEALIEDNMGFTHERICELEELGNPMIAYSGGLELCPGQSLVLEAVPGIGQITWSTGDTGVELEVFVSGVYSYSASNGVCSAMSEELEVVFVQEIFPEVSWTGSLVLCPGSSIELNALPGSGLVVWSNGSSGSTIFASEPGFYSFTETVSGCVFFSDTIYVDVVAAILPMVIAAGATTFCEGDSVLLFAFPESSGLTWSNGSQEPEITVSESGDYFYEIWYENCLFRSDTVTVQVSTVGEVYVVFSGEPYICPSESIVLNTSTQQGQVLWSNGMTTSAIEVSTSGAYYYTVFLNDCVFESDTISIEAAPTLQAQVLYSDSIVCPGTSLVLGSGFNQGLVTWNNLVQGPDLTVFNGGAYSYVLDSLGCQYQSDTVQISEGAAIDLQVENTSSNTLCEGDTLILVASPSGYRAVWNTGVEGDTVVVSSGGGIFFTVDTMNCLYHSDTLEVFYIEQPETEFFFEGEEPVCPGDSVLLIVAGAEGFVLWNDAVFSDSLWVFTEGYYAYEIEIGDCNFGGDGIFLGYHPDWDIGTINGFDTIEPNKVYTYEVSGSTDWEYVWEIEGASIVQGQGSRAINVLMPVQVADSVLIMVTVDDLTCKRDVVDKWVYRDQVIGVKNAGDLDASIRLIDQGSKWIIALDKVLTVEQMNLFTISGKHIGKYLTDGAVLEIDVSALMPGIYILYFSIKGYEPFMLKTIRK